MVHGQSGSHFPDLLIGLLCGEKIVYGEDHGSEVSQPFSLYSHGSPEACVQAGCDPCGTEIGSIVEIGQWLWRFKTTYFGEVARDVEPEQCNDKRLPGGQALRETGRESSKEWRAMLIAAMMCVVSSAISVKKTGSDIPQKIQRPECNHSKDLYFAKIRRRSPQDVI